MADWTGITRNARAHKDFAGRSTTEQDAYFTFFADNTPSFVTRTRKALARLPHLVNARGLPVTPLRVTFGKSPNRS